MAYAINSDRASSLNSLSSYSLSVENKYRFFNCMVFSVMVPVLSVQITEVLPRVSMMLLRLTMMFFFMSFHAPKAVKVVKATGISSGSTDMAIEIGRASCRERVRVSEIEGAV